MNKTWVYVSAALLSFAAPAMARDSAHLACTGITNGDSPYGFAVQFDDHRTENGDGRREVLSAVWTDDLYQGVNVNMSGDPAKAAKITLSYKGKPAFVFFRGEYSFSTNASTGASQLNLKGKINLSPADAKSAEAITTTLECVDFSS